MGKSDKQEIRRIIRVLDDSALNPGWRVVLQSNGHHLAFPPDKSIRAISIPGTPSDHRALLNLKSQLKRAGARGL